MSVDKQIIDDPKCGLCDESIHQDLSGGWWHRKLPTSPHNAKPISPVATEPASQITYFVHKKDGSMEVSNDPYDRDYISVQDCNVLLEQLKAAIAARASVDEERKFWNDESHKFEELCLKLCERAEAAAYRMKELEQIGILQLGQIMELTAEVNKLREIK